MEKIIFDKLEEINLKIYKIQKKQEELFEKYDLLLNEQKKENKDIYKILQQLLLKDLLSTYKDEVTSFLSEQNISNKNSISENLEIKEIITEEKDSEMEVNKVISKNLEIKKIIKIFQKIYKSKKNITKNVSDTELNMSIPKKRTFIHDTKAEIIKKARGGSYRSRDYIYKKY